MKIVSTDIMISTKINLGNYETADISISHKVVYEEQEGATVEAVNDKLTCIFDKLKAKIAEEEPKLKAEILKRRGR